MKEYDGLSSLRRVGSQQMSCPKCRNDVEVVPNGFFHGELFYCPTEKKVFTIYLREIKPSHRFLEQCANDIELKRVRGSINKANMKAVQDAINEIQGKTK